MVKRNPAETKTHNYLLRSMRRDNLLDVMALVNAGRVKLDIFGIPTVRMRDGSWAGNCAWSVDMLQARGLIKREYGTSVYRLTPEGRVALDGALRALGRDVDMRTLLARVDAMRVH